MCQLILYICIGFITRGISRPWRGMLDVVYMLLIYITIFRITMLGILFIFKTSKSLKLKLQVMKSDQEMATLQWK